MKRRKHRNGGRGGKSKAARMARFSRDIRKRIKILRRRIAAHMKLLKKCRRSVGRNPCLPCALALVGNPPRTRRRKGRHSVRRGLVRYVLTRECNFLGKSGFQKSIRSAREFKKVSSALKTAKKYSGNVRVVSIKRREG